MTCKTDSRHIAVAEDVFFYLRPSFIANSDSILLFIRQKMLFKSQLIADGAGKGCTISKNVGE